MIVVLYRGIRRFWEPCIQNQHEFIYENFGSDVVYGMHFWDKQYERLTNRVIGETPKELPIFFRGKKVKHTLSECEICEEFDGSQESKSCFYPCILGIKYAYKNALDLYPDMDYNQTIVILRTDSLIQYKFHEHDKPCVGVWNIKDRENPEIPELADVCIITKKWVLDKLLMINKEEMLEITKNCKNPETYIHKLFSYITNNQIYLDTNMHTGVLRSNHISHCS